MGRHFSSVHMPRCIEWTSVLARDDRHIADQLRSVVQPSEPVQHCHNSSRSNDGQRKFDGQTIANRAHKNHMNQQKLHEWPDENEQNFGPFSPNPGSNQSETQKSCVPDKAECSKQATCASYERLQVEGLSMDSYCCKKYDPEILPDDVEEIKWNYEKQTTSKTPVRYRFRFSCVDDRNDMRHTDH